MKCWICGKEGATEHRGFGKKKYGCTVPFKKQRHYCSECFEKEQERLQVEKAEYIKAKADMMLERAIRLIEKCDVNIYDYKEEIDTIAEFIAEKPEKFKSADEVITAIMLLWNRVDMKINHNVGRKIVDFYLPEHKIALEIDGHLHQNKVYADSQRDELVRLTLGKEWEVVRISAKYVEQNPEMIWEAVKEIKNQKKRLRKQYGGEIPHWFDHKKYIKKPKKVTIGDENFYDI